MWRRPGDAMEEKLRIVGGRRLVGEVEVSGGKNAALAILPAVLLCDGPCVLEHLPMIHDVNILLDILAKLGAVVERLSDDAVRIDPRPVEVWAPEYSLVSRMRASYYLLGVLLGRFGRADVPLPGGCDIGSRPIDLHVKGLRALGADVETNGDAINAKADKLVGHEIYLDVASVGATVNIMLAAAKAEGKTTIFNAACEPHIVDLANFLNLAGARIRGAGTGIIRIMGTEKLNGCRHMIIPDQIETGTMMCVAAATRGDIMIHGAIPEHMEAVSAKLTEMGFFIEESPDSIRVYGNARPRAVNINTLPYPGFPTDLQQPTTVVLSTAQGVSYITESIFEARYKHIEELRRMNARVSVLDRLAVVEGVPRLVGARVSAADLRGGAALVVAGLMAEGVTEISNVRFIDRGYERIEEKLRSLGADIQRV